MSVHAGNFRLVGYGGRPEMKELSEVARRYSLPLVCDLGSGSLFDLSAILPEEPRPSQVLSLGASLVTMSGDKLMGAGQAGLIVGRGDLVEAMRRHPIARAVRIDKLSLAALEATLRLALRPKEAMESIPAMAMLSASQDSLQRKAEALLAAIGPVFGLNLEISEVSGQAGGGSAPATDLPSFAVAASPPEGSLVRLEEALRRGPVPVIGRIFANRLLLDVRTMDEDDFPVVAEAIREAAKASI
jgi:L-seryl-tRNA(Ser) seleniumtransferase